MARIDAAGHLREPGSDHDPTRRSDTDLRANEQAEQDTQGYGLGERLCDSGVYDDTGIEQCEQRQKHVGCDRMKVAFEPSPTEQRHSITCDHCSMGVHLISS